MRRLVALSSVFCMLLCLSCSKDSNELTPDDGKLYDVTFNVSPYTTSIRPMGVGDEVTNLKDIGIEYIEYIIFDADSKDLVTKIKYYGSDHSVIPSNISYKLSKGNYRIMAFANGKKSLIMYHYGVSCAFTFAYTYAGADTFATYQDFTVNEANVSKNLNLERITGRLDFIAEGTIPDDVTELVIKFGNLVNGVGIDSDKGVFVPEIYADGLSKEAIIPVTSDMRSNATNTFSFFLIGNESQSISLKITGRNAINSAVYSKIVNTPIIVYPNKVTELKGPITITDNTEAKMNVTVNTEWSDEKETVTFE